MKKITEDLSWRYAVKKYDPTKKLSQDQLAIIKESLRLTPSSYGLQALKFIFIETPELRSKVLSIAFQQQQVVDASHLLVICALKAIDESYIDNHVTLVKEIRNTPEERAAGFSAFLKSNVLKMSLEDMETSNVRQAYIALGQVLHTCASLRVDATPMEGFNATEMDALLSLEKEGLKSVLLCPMGFRSSEDTFQHLSKVRKSNENIFETR